MSVREFIFGKVEQDFLEKISKREYEAEKTYYNITRVEFDIKFPQLAGAIITYYEGNRLKDEFVRIPLLKISYEPDSVSPAVLISAFTSKILIENPDTRRYQMNGYIQKTLLGKFLELIITRRK
jgi:hypothetical protein